MGPVGLQESDYNTLYVNCIENNLKPLGEMANAVNTNKYFTG